MVISSCVASAEAITGASFERGSPAHASDIAATPRQMHLASSNPCWRDPTPNAGLTRPDAQRSLIPSPPHLKPASNVEIHIAGIHLLVDLDHGDRIAFPGNPKWWGRKLEPDPS